MDKELREKIANWFYVEQAKAERMTKWCSWEEVKTLTPKTAQSLLGLADQILTLIKEAGYCEAKLVRKEIGEAICILVGNTMLKDMEAGKLLGEQLRPIFDLCKREGEEMPE